MQNEAISADELTRSTTIVNNILGYYNSKVVGQPFLGAAILVAMMSNGHILMESVPGLAKTTAAKVMTDAVNGTFSRIQCTPDLIPSDIVGTQIYNSMTNSFENRLGPVYANFVLLDEINRSSAKTQLDRFLLKVKLDYPNVMSELEILNRIETGVLSSSNSVAGIEDMVFLQNMRKRIYMDDSIKRYIVDIVQATRHTDNILPAELAQYVDMGVSTRGAITFMEAAKAVAVINGRTYCTPDDVKTIRYAVLGHRISLNYAAIADGIQVEKIIDAIIGVIPTP